MSAALDASHPATTAFNYSERVIDDTHGDGNLPPTVVYPTYVGDRGGYLPDRNTPRIRVDPNGPWPMLSYAHEIGHLIDNRGLVPPGADYETYASKSNDPSLAAWRQAVEQSAAYKNLQAKLAQAQLGGKAHEDLEYLLRPSELWARSYAQWIASKDPAIGKQLETMRQEEPQKTWSDADFAPILQSIENLFISKGWISKPTGH